jgi:hypothetical protein
VEGEGDGAMKRIRRMAWRWRREVQGVVGASGDKGKAEGGLDKIFQHLQGAQVD